MNVIFLTWSNVNGLWSHQLTASFWDLEINLIFIPINIIRCTNFVLKIYIHYPSVNYSLSLWRHKRWAINLTWNFMCSTRLLIDKLNKPAPGTSSTTPCRLPLQTRVCRESNILYKYSIYIFFLRFYNSSLSFVIISNFMWFLDWFTLHFGTRKKVDLFIWLYLINLRIWCYGLDFECKWKFNQTLKNTNLIKSKIHNDCLKLETSH